MVLGHPQTLCSLQSFITQYDFHYVSCWVLMILRMSVMTQQYYSQWQIEQRMKAVGWWWYHTSGARRGITGVSSEQFIHVLTHRGRVTHICISKPTIIGTDNGLSPERRQVIIQTNAELLSIGPLGTNFSGILSEIHIFSYKKMYLKTLSAKWRPFCLSLNVFTEPRGHHKTPWDDTIRNMFQWNFNDNIKVITVTWHEHLAILFQFSFNFFWLNYANTDKTQLKLYIIGPLHRESASEKGTIMLNIFHVTASQLYMKYTGRHCF